MAQLKLFLLLVAVGLSAALPWIPETRTGARHDAMMNQTADHAADVKVVFLGDSITQGWAGNGKDVWAKNYAPRHAYNYGSSGDRTEHLLWRIPREFEKVNPKLVVLKIGTNNIASSTSGEVATGIFAVLQALQKQFPTSKVLILSVLPRNNLPLDLAVREINTQIAKYQDGKQVFYLDLGSHFEKGLGVEIDGLFYDGLHLTAKGYELWYEVMEPLFAKLIV